MATFRNRGLKWEVQTCIADVRKTKTFPTLAYAKTWAAQQEVEAVDASIGKVPDKALKDLLIRYRDEWSVLNRGKKWETDRINALLRSNLAVIRLPKLTAEPFKARRDERLKDVKLGTVRRELTLLNAAFNKAIREWGWLKVNPLQGLIL